jgi:L-threonylcarbamoyladenylate synthase
MNSLHLKQAIATCQNGGVIAYPTEAVFGLGCIPLFQQSVYRILKLKHRSVQKGLILVASHIEQLDEYVSFEKLARIEKIRNSWPGSVTWLIPARKETPFWLTGGHNTLAVRVSSHPLVSTLCEELGPIVSTSANPAGAQPAVSTQRVRSYFGTDVDYVIPANITNNMNPTEIRDAQTGNIIRVS